MKFELLVLGANSATPLPNRFSSSFVLNHNEHLYLIDCGEGAQIKMSEYQVKRSKINHIFISHLHGDHIFGLPGFINSYCLNGRKSPLQLYGPTGIKQYIDGICATTGAYFPFELIIHEIEEEKYQLIGEIDDLLVYAFPLQHRIPTFGYKFVEKEKSLNILSDAIQKYELTVDEIKQVKRGEDIIKCGDTIVNTEITYQKEACRTFAYCSDTVYTPSIVPFIMNADMIYHEATYLHELADKAAERMHSTAQQAAQIANEAEIGKLIIGHYSTRYRNPKVLLEEAQLTFKNTFLALQGECITVD